MNLKQEILNSINGHYQDAAKFLNTSEWNAENIITGNGLISLDDLQKLLDYLGIAFIKETDKKINYELSVEINNKIFRNYASYWLQKKKYEIRESTYSNYVNLFVNNILPCLGDIPCSDFNNKLLQAFVYWCHEKGGKNHQGVSEHYIRDSLILVKSVIRDGQEENVFPNFAFKNIKIPKSSAVKDVKLTYTEKEYQTIINYIIKHLSLKSFGILLGMFTGMRIGEICALKFSDINFEEKAVYINKTIQRIYNPLEKCSKVIITPGKTENSIRKVPLLDELLYLLKTIRGKDENNYLLSDSKDPIEPRTYRKFYNKFVLAAGVQPIKFHALRHTFASMNIEKGTDVKTVSDILGHADVNITLKEYTHTSQKAKEEAIGKFRKIFRIKEEELKKEGVSDEKNM